MNLNQITISSSNVTKSIAFYKKLGLILIVDALPRYARFECPNGNSSFSIHFSETTYNNQNIVIYFEEKNLDDKINELKSEGLIIDTLPEDKPWLWREASLFDPDGHKIIIYYAGENRLNPPWKV
jgi:catechol 2,3-dioxygenase-like lactoylglutathione lyase family enzyme